MKITIDTASDSHDNIHKAIKMLQSIVGEGAPSNAPYAAQGEKSPIDLFGSPSGNTDNIFTNATEPLQQQDASQNTESVMGIFGEQPSNAIQIISDAPAPQSSNAEVPKQADDEPIEDENLFADLFTKEELERMGKKTEAKAEENKEYSRVYF